jgi:hypothetical protein
MKAREKFRTTSALMSFSQTAKYACKGNKRDKDILNEPTSKVH